MKIPWRSRAPRPTMIEEAAWREACHRLGYRVVSLTYVPADSRNWLVDISAISYTTRQVYLHQIVPSIEHAWALVLQMMFEACAD